MHKRIALFSFTLVMLCLSTLAQADANPLLGTWQLKSFVREVARSGERYNQLGDHPNGYISYSPDGRMVVLFVCGDQLRPLNEPSDEERIKLHKSMLAYGGTYTVSPGKVVHHIDMWLCSISGKSLSRSQGGLDVSVRSERRRMT